MTPCEQCPVLAMCLNKFDTVIICDIVWKYVVIDTEHEYVGLNPLPGPTRHRRVKAIQRIFHNFKCEFAPEDKSDLL